jgi:hypothetical protein
MSRGLGLKQRTILEKLNECEYFYLRDLLPDTCSMSEYQSMYRAAIKLLDRGKVVILKYRRGSKKVLIMRPGTCDPT